MESKKRMEACDKGQEVNLLDLTDDNLCRIVQHIDFRRKCRLQLANKKFYALLKNPHHGGSIWANLTWTPTSQPASVLTERPPGDAKDTELLPHT